MCEPHHSIVQWPNDDPQSGTPLIETPTAQLSGISKVLSWGKKIWEWIHYSKLGSGHSESLAFAGVDMYNRLTDLETRYETTWWDRTVHFDGSYKGGNPNERDLALEASTVYANAVCIGNLSTLRRFLEESIAKSDRPEGYVEMFVSQLIVPKKRDLVVSKLAMVAETPKEKNIANILRTLGASKDRLTKAILGFTRKREFLNTAWADDAKLWQPTVS